MNKPQVLVTGASGFIGRHLVPRLLDKNCDVIIFGRDIKKVKIFDWYKNVDFIPFDFHISQNSFKPKANTSLIHLAWQGLPNYDSLFHIEENLPKSYAFIKDLVRAGVSKVLVAGTCFEYGFQYGPISVKSNTIPQNSYAFAKDSLRRQLEFLKRDKKYTLQWARLFYMYGQGQNPNSILAQLDSAIDRGEPLFNMSGGEQLRDYLSVEQVADQISKIHLDKDDGIFNVCSGIPISIRKLVEDRIKERKSAIKINLGYYPYPDHEPMAFWGQK